MAKRTPRRKAKDRFAPNPVADLLRRIGTKVPPRNAKSTSEPGAYLRRDLRAKE